MAEYIEKEAKTVESAIEEALNEMNIGKDDADIEVLDEGSKGLFGLIGGRNALVRVYKKVDYEEIIKSFLYPVFDVLGIDGDIDITVENNVLNIKLSAENIGIIIGRRGETLDALQYLLGLAEDRDMFRNLMDKLGIPMPESGMASTLDDAKSIAEKIGYPLMIRPSYVLGGRGMEIIYDEEMLKTYVEAASGVTPDRPLLIDKFLENAVEAEADAISDGKDTFVPAVMEHIELAGIHSGDSACVIPPITIKDEHIRTICEYTKKIANELKVVGLMNIQYAIADNRVYVLEANPRASRTVPLVSKVCGISMARMATEVILLSISGKKTPISGFKHKKISHFGVKEAVFPFNMFHEVDPILGPEMRSTGEVLGMANSFGLAFFKAQEATQAALPVSGTVLMSIAEKDKPKLIEIAKIFIELGFTIKATEGTQKFLLDNGIHSEPVKKLFEGRPNIIDSILNKEIQLIVNTPIGKQSQYDDSYIRKAAIKYRIPYITTITAALASVKGIAAYKANRFKQDSLKSLQEYHGCGDRQENKGE